MTAEVIWFDADWKVWIKTNIENGQDKNTLFKILLEEGFSHQAICDEMQFEPVAKTTFNADWKAWIKTNVENGQDKNGLFKILLDEGFTYKSIHQAMQFEPSLPVEDLVNPFKPKKQVQENSHLPAVDLNQLYIPNGKKLDSEALQVFTVDNFLNAFECEAIAADIKRDLSKVVLNDIKAQRGFHQGGFCDVCDFGVNLSPLYDEIEQRICKLIGISSSYSEPLNWQYMGVDQNLKSYANYLEQHEMDNNDALIGHRTYAVMIYLNDLEAGGGTHFLAPNRTIKPQTGLAVIWSNLDNDGLPKSQSARKSPAIVQGHQFLITKWFRSEPIQPLSDKPSMFTRDINELIPVYTEFGFTKATLPLSLFSEVQEFYHSNQDSLKEETVAGDFIVNTTKLKTNGSSLIDLSPELRATIHDNLKALLENWCGKTLLPTYVYGIRIYHRGAALKCHRDRLATHIIGVIINVDQEVDEDWILVIDDHQYRRHQITLKPGEMIFYESGRLIHGRPSPLNGNLFANIFCHFKPTDYLPRAVTQQT